MATVMAEHAAVHPFFSKATGLYNPEGKPREEKQSATEDQLPFEPQNGSAHEQKANKVVTKPRSIKQNARNRGQPTLHQVLHQETPVENGQGLIDDDNHDEESERQRKRRKKSCEAESEHSDERIDMVTQKEGDASNAVKINSSSSARKSRTDAQASETKSGAVVLDEDPSSNSTQSTMRTPPKKMLRLNGTGRFSSPISETHQATIASEASVKPRTRNNRKSKDAHAKQVFVVKMKYGVTDTIGQRIDQILSGELSIKLPDTTIKAPRTPRKRVKNIHPFFAEKSKTTAPVKQQSPRKTTASTPGKLKTQTRFEQHASTDSQSALYESALLKDRLMVKHPGAMEPLWPAKGTSHVRGLDRSLPPTTQAPRGLRKMKDAQRAIPLSKSILTKFAQAMQPEPETVLRPDGFREPSSDIRIPQKILISGIEVAQAVIAELGTDISEGPVDELALTTTQQSATHPALFNMYKSIPPYTSGFDHLKGESLGWAHRYAPGTTDDVLQPLKEMKVLKTWLKSMTVNAVDANTDKQAGTKPPNQIKKRRKLRHPDLDDFIVDEDDDTRSMDILSDSESATGNVQSIVQSQVAGTRSSNAILISGPSGCGKTAAVHAVAKELGYRVFEISSAERRSGKDILDKIGNVTENHIVKSHHETAPIKNNEECELIDAAFKKDLESGRQGKMSAFFKPKVAQLSTKSAKQKIKVVKEIQKALKKPTREQQQSLILLEEVDVLYKDDKEFWTTVMKMILTSKRPFVMTCNDEDLVPIQAMSLHAVLRLCPPQSQLAVDYLLLVAAREGHLLSRSAVTQLWEESTHDLRRSLHKLDFWCRMGVGDVRDGLGWMLQRWPPGSDLDDKGRLLRVISEGTFQAGMGAETNSDDFPALKETADLDLMPPPAPAEDIKSLLHDFERYAKCMSDVDMFLGKASDPTLPRMSEKTRAQYIEGMAVLDVQETAIFNDLTRIIQITTTDMANKLSTKRFSSLKIADISMPRGLSRKDFTVFDVLAAPLTTSSQSTGLEASVFDGSLQDIAVDIAPYVRQIVRYDLALEEQRNALTGNVKRARKTRAARSALEGGQRQLTRRAEWFEGAGDLSGVLATAGREWHTHPMSPLLDDGDTSSPPQP